ncbi:MAG: hypothetical protein AAF481_16010 [Acidobacteriota bacterium]
MPEISQEVQELLVEREAIIADLLTARQGLDEQLIRLSEVKKKLFASGEVAAMLPDVVRW